MFICSFEPLSKAKAGISAEAPIKAPALPRKLKKKVPQPSISSLSDITASLGSVTASPDVSSTAASGSQPYRRRHGKLHTARVDFLLKKYLGQTNEEQITEESSTTVISPLKGEISSQRPAEQIAKPNDIDALTETLSQPIPAADPAPTPETVTKIEVPPVPLKRIMQVKDEQDAAIREMQHTPRPFYAKPVPLAVAMTSRVRLSSDENATKIPSISQGGQLNGDKPTSRPSLTTNRGGTSSTDRENCPDPSLQSPPLTARSVPPSTTEPRYAMMVADSVLRRYNGGGSEKNEKLETPEESGLQRWPSWPGQSVEEGEANVMQSLRPQSARPRRSNPSQSPVHLAEIEEAPEEVEEIISEESSADEIEELRQETQDSDEITEKGSESDAEEDVAEDEGEEVNEIVDTFEDQLEGGVAGSDDVNEESEDSEPEPESSSLVMRPQAFFVQTGDSDEDEE